MFNSIREFQSGLGTPYVQQPSVSQETKINFMNLLPQEVSLEIFSHLNRAELGRCLLVSRTWNVLASDEALSMEGLAVKRNRLR